MPEFLQRIPRPRESDAELRDFEDHADIQFNEGTDELMWHVPRNGKHEPVAIMNGWNFRAACLAGSTLLEQDQRSLWDV